MQVLWQRVLSYQQADGVHVVEHSLRVSCVREGAGGDIVLCCLPASSNLSAIFQELLPAAPELACIVLAGPEIRAISGACTSSQARSTALCCQLQEVQHKRSVTLLIK